jgi:hypothetical protein
MAEVRWLGSHPRLLLMVMTLDLKAGPTVLPHAISGIIGSMKSV